MADIFFEMSQNKAECLLLFQAWKRQLSHILLNDVCCNEVRLLVSGQVHTHSKGGSEGKSCLQWCWVVCTWCWSDSHYHPVPSQDSKLSSARWIFNSKRGRKSDVQHLITSSVPFLMAKNLRERMGVQYKPMAQCFICEPGQTKSSISWHSFPWGQS